LVAHKSKQKVLNFCENPIIVKHSNFGYVTALNRCLVSKRSLLDPSLGRYCLELDPSNLAQFVFKLCNTSIVYCSTLQWDEQYFNLVPELSGPLFEKRFINDNKEEYFQYNLLAKNMTDVSLLARSGQNILLIWVEDLQEWLLVYTQPEDSCDVYATCGPFAICNSNYAPPFDCMKGFSVRSPMDREQRVRLVRVSGPTRLTGCRRATFGCLHRPQSQALQMQFPSSCLHPQKRQKQPFLRSQARLMQLFLSLMMY
jgi:hypothetical protein